MMAVVDEATLSRPRPTLVELSILKRQRRHAKRVAALERFIIFFSLYTFSIGPMYWTWYESRYMHGNELVAIFYEPLRLLGEWVPFFGEWLNWYVKLWIL